MNDHPVKQGEHLVADFPPWLAERLRCPRTGVPLERDVIDGRWVYTGYPEGEDPVVYRVDGGVPILLPQ